ncbi:MAG: flagellar biosynthesis protein FlhA [Thermosediminibacterales bacterium]|nr:flagellar biosynthesis protein FlhA [Thermosediminibacterales bacterium]MDK2901226.1 flagellar biosynthesis protein FlhA [Thermosediminibacterales bacterium]
MKFGDILVVIAVIAIVIMMIIPLPTFILDLLLTFNITLALVILLVSMYTLEPLQFSIFPSLLLLTTLFRLALNVSSTRLILINGFAGNVIRAFGEFVIGSNALVGFIIFLILIVIQFIVITKGAERVAEVAARFTLDGMPGKQMSIDADLNAGLITDAEARKRRLDIQREADFYGAMDGASKFVKGDAIAAIIITIINIIGGLITGMIFKNMDFSTAVSHYTLLTVGDGLVSQIPALLISTATGIIVTRAASDSNLGEDLLKQILSHPKVLLIASAALAFLGIMPGLPTIPFFVLSAIMGFSGYSMYHTGKKEISKVEEEEIKKETDYLKKPENVVSLLQVDPIELEFGYGIIPLADVNQGGDLLDRVIMIRRQCAVEMGIIVPVIRIRDNIQLRPNEYVIKIKGVEVSRGELKPDHYLAMNPGTVEEEIEGVQTVEPAFGLPAVWISKEKKDKAEMLGYTVVDSPSVIATHLTEVIKRYAHELLGRQEVKMLADSVKESHPALIEELVPKVLSLGEIQKVLANLLKEGISIRDLVTIFETLADYGNITKDPDMLTEYVRQALSRVITKKYVYDNRLKVITLDPKLEELIRDSIQQTDHGNYLSINPEITQKIFTSLSNEIKKFSSINQEPVILTSPVVRLFFRRLIEHTFPNLAVLSFNEIEPRVEVQSIGMVSIK